MDQRLKEALDFSQFRTTLQIQKANLKNKAENQMTVSHKGGLFRADQNLISYVSSLISTDIKQYVILDQNEIPVMIDNLLEFRESLIGANKQAMNEWYSEYSKLKTSRSVAKLTGVELEPPPAPKTEPIESGNTNDNSIEQGNVE